MAGIKAKAKVKGDAVEIKALMKHPMETGQRKDKAGKVIPAHHITEITVKAGEKILMTANYGPAVSKNPYISLVVSGPSKGDSLSIGWVDNKGENANIDVVIK
ncbi:MAG: sulfur-oxidizing protein SoxZ [Gammaproteobacteria bacterium]|jgi:sulfur-oxidizing protein SoxZ